MQSSAKWIVLGGWVLATGACSSTPTPSPATVSPSASTTSEAPSPSMAAPSPETVPAGPPPTGRVVNVSASKESATYLHVEIGFDNKSARPCKILGYALTWPGGKKDISLEDFTVPPRDGKTRSVKVHPDDGDLSALKPDKASIVVRSDCDGPSP